MDVNLYGLERLAHARLVELRAESARRALVSSLRSARPGIRAVIGLALIRAGRRMLRPHAERRLRASLPSSSLP